jgi:hypothetical protein
MGKPRGVLWPNRKMKPPFGAVEIDRAHPLASGLQICVLFSAGAPAVYNLVSGARLTPVGSPVCGSGPYGSTGTFDGAGDYYELPNPGAVFNGCGLTAIARLRFLDAGTSYPRVLDRAYGGQFACYLNTSSPGVFDLGMAIQTTGISSDTTGFGFTGTLQAGTWRTCGWVYDKDEMRCYLDGVSSVPVTTPSGGLATSTSAVRIGNRVDGTNRDYKGDIEYVYAWNRALTQAEITQVTFEPYCFLRSIKRRSGGWKPTSAGGTQYAATLTGDLTPTGVVLRSTSAWYAGSVAPAGTALRQIQATKAGAIATITGAIQKQVSKTWTGAISTITGTVAKQVSKTWAGTIATITGTAQLGLGYLRTFAGAISTITGALTKQAQPILRGALAPTGAIRKSVSMLKAGTLTPAGAVLKRIARTFAGVLASLAGAIGWSTPARGRSIALPSSTRTTTAPASRRSHDHPASTRAHTYPAEKL